jgi:hypothetical protein
MADWSRWGSLLGVAAAILGGQRTPEEPPSRSALPLRFEAGPVDGFLARCGNFALRLDRGEAIFALGRPSPSVVPGGWSGRGRRPARSDIGSVVRMRFGGEVTAAGLRRLPGESHYLLGSDRARWRTGVPSYEGAIYRGVRPGVDLVFRGNPRRLEYDLHVGPGGDPASLVFRFEGASTVAVDARGDLVLGTPDGDLRHGAPVAWQEGRAGERVPVPARWVLGEEGRARIEAGPFDRTRPLVVDPVVSYSTYLGGGDLDTVYATATDAAGALYLTGWSRSTNFPTAGAYQASYAGGIDDVFVAKLSPDGSGLAYATYIGGNGFDEAYGIHVDGNGSAAIGGITSSTNFPVVGPFLNSNSGGSHDAFVARLAPNGASLAYGTYYGGSGFDDVWAFTVGSGGTYWFCGATSSTNLPLGNSFQAAYGGGTHDAYVVCLDASGSSLVHGSYLGGSGDETATALAVDGSGKAHIGGWTSSTNFPTVIPVQGAYAGGNDDAFCAAVGPTGETLAYSTYFGGSGFDEATAVVVDAAGRPSYAGFSSSTNLTLASPFQSAYGGGGDDAFLLRLTAAGNGVLGSSYLGGSGFDQPYAMSLDGAGALYFGGFTYSTNFPVKYPVQASNAGGLDEGWIAKVSAAGNALEFATYLGGSGYDEVLSLRADGTTVLTVGGITSSSDFQVQSPYQQAPAGGVHDGFAIRFLLVPPVAPSGLSASPTGPTAVHLAWTDGSADEVGFQVERREPPGAFAPLTLTAAGANAFDDLLASPGRTYVYRVRSVSWEGGSSWSNESTASTPYKPAAPSGLQAITVSPTGIDLSWTDGSDNETGFEITKRTEAGSFSTLAVTGPDATSREDRGLLPDTTYVYRVRALGDAGTSAYAPDASARTDPTVAMALTKGSLKDSTSFGKDKASVAGIVSFLPAAGDQVFDPVADGLGLQVGDGAAPLQVSIPPGDLGWKERNGKFTWKSAPRTVPKVVLTWVPATGEMKVKVSKAQFPAPPANPVRWSLRGGNDGGTLYVDWTVKKPGNIAYP